MHFSDPYFCMKKLWTYFNACFALLRFFENISFAFVFCGLFIYVCTFYLHLFFLKIIFMKNLWNFLCLFFAVSFFLTSFLAVSFHRKRSELYLYIFWINFYVHIHDYFLIFQTQFLSTARIFAKIFKKYLLWKNYDNFFVNFSLLFLFSWLCFIV